MGEVGCVEKAGEGSRSSTTAPLYLLAHRLGRRSELSLFVLLLTLSGASDVESSDVAIFPIGACRLAPQ